MLTGKDLNVYLMEDLKCPVSIWKHAWQASVSWRFLLFPVVICVISRWCTPEPPTACRAIRLSFIVTTKICTSLMTLRLWESHTAVVGNIKGMWKTTTRKEWRSKLRVWLTKQQLHFNKDRYLLLRCLLLPQQGLWSHFHSVSRVLLALVQCQPWYDA